MFFRAYAGSKILEIVLDVKNAQPFRLLGSFFAVTPPLLPLFSFLRLCLLSSRLVSDIEVLS